MARKAQEKREARRAGRPRKYGRRCAIVATVITVVAIFLASKTVGWPKAPALLLAEDTPDSIDAPGAVILPDGSDFTSSPGPSHDDGSTAADDDDFNFSPSEDESSSSADDSDFTFTKPIESSPKVSHKSAVQKEPGNIASLSSTAAGGCVAPQELANGLLQHWTQKSNTFWDQLRSARPDFSKTSSPNATEVLMRLKYWSASDMCYTKLTFNGSHVVVMDNFTAHCNISGLATSSRLRCVALLLDWALQVPTTLLTRRSAAGARSTHPCSTT